MALDKGDVKEEECVHCSRGSIAPAFTGVSTPSKARAIAFAMKGCLSCGLVMYDCMGCETSKESSPVVRISQARARPSGPGLRLAS